MIKGSIQAQRNKPQVLVENKISFAGPNTELSIYDTFEQASKVHLQSDQLMFCGMVTGKKVMHDDKTGFETEFLPHESFVMAPNQAVAIDFPEAQIEQPTTCLAIEISPDKITRTLETLEQESPLAKDYGYWRYQRQLVHTHHNSQTQHLLNRIVQIYTENHQDRSLMIDFAVSELTVRLLRHQTRDFIIAHCQKNPEQNGLNAALTNIQNNLDKPLDIDALCKIACMSRTKFYQQFKANLGCSPAAYQHQTRLTLAAQAIKSGKQITQVCFELGFANASHFSKCFKQFYGISPSAFKARHETSHESIFANQVNH